ncbi:saccharopine dehydrogenase family protein [Legionella hackeliae]|uniref:Putative saccharopine dehydrogenase n=2 Tax=Legionella hackeliae TaxID=449 RepID=A0A0A8UVH7_LEGHA|nr:saccharopine dehydrogenase NADP-binding domain-containing protein [Legionella hackeliae]KTD06649.1 saccharopine dehydrogenase [Legionella hackeliae]CEK10769.1 putative saccharopine dehydrogenase [Legionella hackeliae]
MSNWLIYGANGYTGRLIAKEAKLRGLNPILAGRNEHSIKALAEELGFKSCIFELSDLQNITEQLADIKLILNCAGPFSSTAKPLIKACIHSKTHYLDITGEISVFEYAHSKNELAEEENIILCPGVGFDVIPTDCVAAKLKQILPDANYLALGFDSDSGMSAGTAKTAVEGLALGGRARINGQIKRVPLAWKSRRIDFGRGERLATTIPWGDVSTAFYTTGIPNIEVYIPISPKRLSMLKKLNYIRWFLGLRWIQNYIKSKAAQQRGPDTKQLQNQLTYVWGEAKNAQGNSQTIRIKTANGYALTVKCSLTVVEHLLNTQLKGGYKTPSQIMGIDFITQLPGYAD